MQRLNNGIDTLPGKTREEKQNANTRSANLNGKIRDQLIGCHFPNVALKTNEGRVINSESLKGKPTFITFWFSTCSPCVAEIPWINKLINEYGASVNFLSISVDHYDVWKEFLNHKTYMSQQALISKPEASDKFCVISGYPNNLILDPNGKVTDIWSGGFPDPANEIFYKRVKKGLDALLKQK